MIRRALRRKGDSASDLLDQRVPVPSPIRVALAAILLLGGAVLVFSVVSVLFTTPQRPSPDPLAAVLIALLVLALGGGCLFVGVRMLLLRHQHRSQALFGSRARTTFGILLGVAAACMGIAAWWSNDVAPAIHAVGVAFFSFLILRSSTSSEHE